MRNHKDACMSDMFASVCAPTYSGVFPVSLFSASSSLLSRSKRQHSAFPAAAATCLSRIRE
jgi:hypothetical protein